MYLIYNWSSIMIPFLRFIFVKGLKEAESLNYSPDSSGNPF
jgi:hypothetical protein